MRRASEGDVRDELAIDVTAAGSSAGGLTRRQVLQAGAGAGMALAALDAAPVSANAWADPRLGRGPRWELSFDEDWRFYRGDLAGARGASFDDRSWRQLDVPHDWRIEDLPYATSDDGGATTDPSAFAFVTRPSPDGNPPQAIGPFDVNADPAPDGDITYPGVGEFIIPGGRNQGYTVPGVGWYRKHFTVPDLHRGQRRGPADGAQRRVELRFDGVYGRTDVWLNGRHLGFHAYGYTSFAYDLTPYLNPHGQKNVLAVRVDNRGKTSRWYSGSGIYRHTWLTITGSVRIPLWGVDVTTPVVDARRSVAHVDVQVANFGAAAAASVRMTVIDARGRPVATRTTSAQNIGTGATHTYAADLGIANAALWSPEDPNLYQVRTEVLLDHRVVDAGTTTFGIRSLVWNGTAGLLLNGKPTKILGGNIHHDHGALGAVALDRAEERTIEILKAAGFNAIRASHNPRAPYMLDVCDRLGMLVWDEFCDMWDTAKSTDDYSNYFPKHWKQDLTSMVLRDRNHPSVIIWSLGNEIPADPNNYGRRMRALVRSLDTTRPITAGGTTGSGSYSDVLDVHYGNWTSQLSGQPAPNTVLSTHASALTKAVVQSESFSASIYDDFKLAEDHKWMVGSFVWTAWDYLGESGISAPASGAPYQAAAVYQLGATLGQVPYPWFNAFSGDIDLIGQRKAQNYWRAVVYGLSTIEMMVERPTPAGTQQYAAVFGYRDELPSWTWDVPDGQAMTVHVYTSGDSVTLLLNGNQLATKTLTDADMRVATFSVPYARGELTAIASRNGRQIANKTLATTGQPAAIRLTSDVDTLSTSRGDLAHVLAEVVDSRGQRVPDAVVRISFQVSGAGALIGVANGNPHNVDSFQRPRHWTWHGQALAILRPTKTPGTLGLTATAPGLTAASLTLAVSPADHASVDHRLSRGPRLATSLVGPGLALGLGAAVLEHRMQHTESPVTTPPDNADG